MRRLDLRDDAPRRQAGDVLRDVVPFLAAVARVPELAVVGAGPDQPLLHLRRRDREDHLGRELAQVVADDAAGRNDAAGVLRGEIGADDAPALSAAVGVEDDVAAVVDVVVIERIDRQRRRPVAAVLRILRRRIEGDHPRRHRSRDLGAVIVAGHLVAVAGGPDDVRIGRIGSGKARLAAAEPVVPLVAGAVVAGARPLRGDRGPAHRPVVLHVRVDVVRHLVVDGDVIHLADRQLHPPVAAPVLGRQRDAGVVRDREPIGVLRIPPDVVVVAAPVDGAKRLAAVDRLEERAVGDEDFVLVGRRDGEMDVVAGAADQLARPVDHAPVRAAVVGSPDRALILGLNQRVDAIRVGRRDRDVDLAERRSRQAGRLDLRPFRAAVARHVDAAPRAAAQHRPRVHLDLPGARPDRARVLRVHREPGAAGVLVDEQHPIPVRAAVGGAKDAALLLRRRDASDRAREHDVGVGRVDEDAADAPGVVEAHVAPRLAGVGRLVDAVADDVAVANRPRFPGAGPDDVGIGRRDGERANRGDRQAVGHRGPAECRRRSSSRRRPTRRRRSRSTDRRARPQSTRRGCRRPARESGTPGRPAARRRGAAR